MLLVLGLVLVMGAGGRAGKAWGKEGVLGCGGALWGDGDREARRMMLLGLAQAALHSRLARPVLGAPGERLYRRTATQKPGAHWPAQESSLVGALVVVLLLLVSAATGVPVVQVQVQVHLRAKGGCGKVQWRPPGGVDGAGLAWPVARVRCQNNIFVQRLQDG